jgi:2-dehydropantoate 2-reductase
MGEIAEIARTTGIEFSDEEVYAAISNSEKFPPGTTSSLFSDTQRKQQTEVELLQGHLATLADKHGVSAPISRAIYALLREKTSF